MKRLVVILCSLSGLMPLLQAREEVMVDTALGRVRGYDNGLTKSFKGIPYAMPPIGLLRWQPPQAPPAWHPEVLDATQDPPGCPQIHCEHLTPAIACPKNTSENCLYVSIFTPTQASNTSKLPVMVYLHGGNFFFMSGVSPVYDGDIFVQKGQVILVNVDYRLGALGFLVTGSREQDATGNYGLYDQALALKWVKDNIQQFGGDPNKITLFGQSSGAQSVLHHMTSEESSAYFDRVIIESSPLSLPYKTFNEAFVLGGFLAQQLNCPVADLKCMRSKSAEEVALAAWNSRSKISSVKFLEMFEPYGPYVDGTYVKGQPLDLFAHNQYSKKPIIVGTTTEETVLYVYGYYNSSVSIPEYATTVTLIRPSKVLEILNQYPPSPTSGDQRETMVEMGTDLVFGCPTRNLSRIMVGQGESAVWMYQWNHAFSFPGWGAISYCEGRVCHGSEIVYVFDTAYKGNFSFTPEEKTLSDAVIAYWTNFAKTGDPNSNGDQTQFGTPPKPQHQFDLRSDVGREPDVKRMRVGEGLAERVKAMRTGKAQSVVFWPKYSPTSGWQALEFQTPANQIISNYRSAMCDFWDSIGY